MITKLGMEIENMSKRQQPDQTPENSRIYDNVLC